jgi:hypothetical protein
VIQRRYKMFLWVGPLLALSWFSLAILDTEPGGGIAEMIGIGYCFGSLFGHATLSAAWAALGPGRLLWRLPLSLVWVLMLGMALAINTFLNGGPDGWVVVGVCFFAQWLALQLPLWALKAGLRAQLMHVDDQVKVDKRNWQFGIRQLLIVTTIVGVVFGIGRLVVSTLLANLDLSRGEGPIFLFLAFSAVVFTLPLLIAALLKRWTIVAVLVVLVLIGAATFWEAPLLQVITKSGGRPNAYDLLAVNAFTALIVLVVAALVRLNGYSLIRAQPETD